MVGLLTDEAKTGRNNRGAPEQSARSAIAVPAAWRQTLRLGVPPILPYSPEVASVGCRGLSMTTGRSAPSVQTRAPPGSRGIQNARPQRDRFGLSGTAKTAKSDLTGNRDCSHASPLTEFERAGRLHAAEDQNQADISDFA